MPIAKGKPDPAADQGDGYRIETGRHPIDEEMKNGEESVEKSVGEEGTAVVENRPKEGENDDSAMVTSSPKDGVGIRSRGSSILQNNLATAVSMTWVAPDGGWGWVVVFCALVISLIVDGLTYTFGIFLGEFEAEFDAPKSTVSLAGSLQVGVYLMVGPIVSALTNRFGCRPVVISGSIVSASAFVISSFSPELPMLIAFYGFFGGLGFGMMYLPAIVAVSVYFEKRRALATGIAVCGSGIGTLILAPLTKVFLREFSWRWSLVILGGLILTAVVCGGLMKSLEPINRSVSPSSFRKVSSGADCRQQRVSLLSKSDVSENGSPSHAGPRHKSPSMSSTNSRPPAKEMIPLITVTDELETTKIVLTQKKDPKQPRKEDLLSPNRQAGDNAMLFSSVPNNIGGIGVGRGFPSQHPSLAIQPMSNSHSSFNVTDMSTWNSRARAQTVDYVIKGPFATEVVPKAPKENLPIGLSFIGLSDAHINKIRDDVAVRLSRRDISRSVSLIPQDFNAINQEGFITSIVSINTLASRDGDIGAGLWNSLKDTLQEMLDFGILKDKRYLFVLAGNFFCMIGFYVPFVYIPDRAKELGIADDKAAFLISVIGIANIIGRVATGVVVNFLKIDSLLVTSLALSMCGIVTAVCPLCESYPTLIVMSIVFGLGVAAYISLCSILLCELLGVKNLTNAFGFVILFRGVACIIGPPIAGVLIDSTGMFHPAFYLGGGMIFLAAIFHAMLFIPGIKKADPVTHDKAES